ncbi:hypothetical protein MELE44368_15400 [Mycolicibacterium elephantis DSM 44368]|uniref:Uncharacterized protein n=1 Tax=Mycolicibacterium elephantis DSM 44368 TaxID=1335622 RepID=A0A439DWW9_9MYCO|nr:hypothetical protein MELE44368_15400 [Mycolicibacterium elephantis DSM 44368]
MQAPLAETPERWAASRGTMAICCGHRTRLAAQTAIRGQAVGRKLLFVHV